MDTGDSAMAHELSAVSGSRSGAYVPHQQGHAPYPSPQAPHEAPPLHMNLAGSPHGMSRSSSSSADSDMPMGLSPRLKHVSHAQDPFRSSVSQTMPHEVPMPPSPPRRQGWKVTFGYRSDCQKCIDRVPGHYSHVVMEGQGLESSPGAVPRRWS